MTFTDYLLDLFLIGIVLVQIRGRRVTMSTLLLPLAIVGYFAVRFLHVVPRAGNDLLLVVVGAGVGTLLGMSAGWFTRVSRREDGATISRAGAVAATLWTLGTVSRFAFQLYATHGGAGAIGKFSAAHAITSSAAWTDCILLMALGEVVARSAVIAVRTWKLSRLDSARGLRGFTRTGAAMMDAGGSTS